MRRTLLPLAALVLALAATGCRTGASEDPMTKRLP